jgi:hypothetical protein
MLGGPLSRSGRGGEEKNSQSLPGFELAIIQPVAQRYTIELTRRGGKVMGKNFISVQRYSGKQYRLRIFILYITNTLAPHTHSTVENGSSLHHTLNRE